MFQMSFTQLPSRRRWRCEITVYSHLEVLILLFVTYLLVGSGNRFQLEEIGAK